MSDPRAPRKRAHRLLCRCPGCGYHTSFETNLGEDLITIACHSCGYPIDFEYSRQREAYVPISDTGPDRQRKRGSRRH